MASYTAHHVTGTGLNIYAKQLPLNTSNWATGVTTMSEVLTTGIYTATLASQNRYLVFVQSGGSPSATDLVDGSFASSVWDDVLTGATHNIATSAGRRLRTLGDTVVLAEGTAAGGDNAGPSGAGTITLENGIGTVCVGQAIRVRGQVRYIESYDTNTDVAVVDQAWCEIPENGDDYTIFNLRTPLIGRISTAVANTFGGVLANLQSMIEDVSGWRFTSKALEQGPTVQVELGGLAQPFQTELDKPVRMTAGDTKKTADGNALLFPVTLPESFDPSGTTITFAAERRPKGLGAQDFISSTDCSFTEIDGADFVAVQFLTSASTDKRPGEYDWNVVVKKGTSEITKTRGVMVLLPKYLPPPP
jgi:hypothetical protein